MRSALPRICPSRLAPVAAPRDTEDCQHSSQSRTKLGKAKDKVPVTERREIVARLKLERKSNRSIALELRVDEGTIRRDVIFLGTPEADRPIPRRLGRKQVVRKRTRKSQPKLEKAEQTSRSVAPVYDPGDPLTVDRQERRTVKAVKAWYLAEKLSPRDAEEIVIEAARLLWNHGCGVGNIPLPKEAPDHFISSCRPTGPPADGLQHVAYHGEWLARILAACLPREESVREAVLRDVMIWARRLSKR